MRFPFNAYLLAVFSALATTFLSLPLWRKWCLRTGLVDDPGRRKIHHTAVPLAGGLAVMTGLLLPIVLGAIALSCLGNQSHPLDSFAGAHSVVSQESSAFTPEFLLRYGLSHRSVQLAGVIAGALGMLFLGYLDDKHELRPRMKFTGQLFFAGLVAASGVRITLFVPGLLFSYAVTILWIITVINAFNFMDNMNGLCAGLGAIAAGYFAVIAATGGQYLVALIAFLSFGALLGFLPYNFPRARAFLGDTGSHLIGYLLSVLAILPHFYTARHRDSWAVLIPLIVLAVPLLDLVWVVILRWRIGQPFYEGDNNHLSHRLVRGGFTQTRAVLLIWLLAALVGGLSLLF